ncbi:MAG: TonB-dependent receptor [Chitinophagaceae bacterium]|nr:TonB-dependent receptor [Chitinophagaceae bacterium]
MKKEIIYVFLLLCSINIFTTAAAQNFRMAGADKPPAVIRVILSGKITDAKTGEPLAGATIYFPDLRTGGSSNQQGFYKIQNIPQGKHLVEISYQGYASVVETIELNGDMQKGFALSASYIENEAVTVTGVSSATSVKRTPVPVNILKRDDLFRNTSTNLVDALSKTPGVSQLSTGPAVSKPFIRGLGYNRVVVVNDGVRQEGQQWGDEHAIEIDEYNVNKAEVLKGPASLMYGSDALAGVVNIISVRPSPEATIRGNVFGTYQTNNRLRGLHADIGGNNKGFIWGAYASYKAAADYKNKYDDYVFNSKFNEKNFGGYIGLNKHWGFSHLLVSNFNQLVGLVEGERDDATGKFLKLVNNNGIEEEEITTEGDFKSVDPFIPAQRIKHFKITADNSFHLGKNRLTVLLGYQRNQRQEFGNVTDPEEKELFFDLNTLNYNFQYHFAEHNNWKTTIGVSGMQQSNNNKGAEALIPEYKLFDIGAFVYMQKRVKKATLSGGLRIDNRSLDSKRFDEAGSIKFEQFKKTFSNISGSAGLSYEASDAVTIKFNIARGFRAPSIPELASNGAHEGTNRYEYGEQNLKSETSLQLDGGIEMVTEHVSLASSVFYNAVNNFIYYGKLSSVSGGDSIIVDGADNFFAFRFDQNNAELYGAEMNLDIHPHPLDWLHIENTFSYVRGTLNNPVDGSKNLPFIPAARLINEIKADFFKKGKPVRNVFFLVELDNTFEQDKPFTGFDTETATPGYSLINAAFGSEVVNKGRTLFSFYFSANNITDKAYQNHLSRLKYTAENMVTGRTGVFNMGRNFSIKLNVPLNFSVGSR